MRQLQDRSGANRLAREPAVMKQGLLVSIGYDGEPGVYRGRYCFWGVVFDPQIK